MSDTENRAISTTSLVVMAAIEKLGDGAIGIAVVEYCKMVENTFYNTALRLVRRGYVSSERKGLFTTYALTKEGAAFLKSMRKALA